jgi:hypothetical protein
MQEPHSEEIATHTGPESCVVIRKGKDKALTGVRIGWVLSREIRFIAEGRFFGTPTPSGWRKATLDGSISRDASRPASLETPRMCGDTLVGNQEVLRLSVKVAERIGSLRTHADDEWGREVGYQNEKK